MALISSSVMVPYGNYDILSAHYHPNQEKKKRESETYAHMNIPWWICHDDMEFAEDRVVEPTQVAVNPLWWELKHKQRSVNKMA